MDFSDVIIWQLRQKIWSSAKDLFGITFLDGAKLSNERNGCWRKKTNWPGNGFSENEKRALLDFFFLVSMQLMVLEIKPTFALQVLNCKTNHTVV